MRMIIITVVATISAHWCQALSYTHTASVVMWARDSMTMLVVWLYGLLRTRGLEVGVERKTCARSGSRNPTHSKTHQIDPYGAIAFQLTSALPH